MKQCEMCARLRRPVKQNYTLAIRRHQAAQIVSATLRAFQQAMPKVHVKLHDWSNEEIAVGLRDGRLSVAFIARPLKRGAFRDFRFEELLREHVRLAVPPNHPFAQRRSVSLADAAQEPFVGLTREDFPDYHSVPRHAFRSGKKQAASDRGA